jgi:ribonuclease D
MNLYKSDIPSGLSFSGSVALDTETMGLVLKRDRLCLVQMCSKDGDVHIVQMQPGVCDKSENLKRILVDESVLKIFHFARFDIAVLNHAFGIRVAPVYCTKVASKLARTYTERHGLKHLCKELLNVEISKNEQTSDWGQETLSHDQLKYAAGDVLHLHKLKDRLDAMLQREHKEKLAQKCFDALPIIADLELANVSPEELFQH